jgi:hypothetical protein
MHLNKETKNIFFFEETILSRELDDLDFYYFRFEFIDRIFKLFIFLNTHFIFHFFKLIKLTNE